MLTCHLRAAIHSWGSTCFATGMIAVGLFVDRDALFNTRNSGLFQNGSFHLLGAQVAAIVAIMLWSSMWSYLTLKAIATFMPIRVDKDTEETGLDVSLNKINTDYDWDKILSPNPDPTKTAGSSKERTRKQLAKVITAIIAVNRLIQNGSNSRFRHKIKEHNTKILAQSWSSIRPVQTSARIRPMHTEPHG